MKKREAKKKALAVVSRLIFKEIHSPTDLSRPPGISDEDKDKIVAALDELQDGIIARHNRLK